MKTYEGMFLLDAGLSDFDTASEPIRQVLTRIEADVINFRPWDERRLAYPVDGCKRALYVLTYFKADPARMGELDHEISLNPGILRAMVFSADHASEERISAETPATLQSARRAAAEARKADEAAAAAKAAEDAAAAEKAPAPEPPAPDAAQAAEDAEKLAAEVLAEDVTEVEAKAQAENEAVDDSKAQDDK